ncbi:Protein K04C2.7 [Aphelenchoides avenae]|nr:Protein K04C2.7 [Aphelenchus avenae]
MTSFLVITDQHSKIFGHRLLNSQLALYIGVIQLFVCIWSLTQHVFSILAFDKILHCDFSNNSTLPPLLTAVDAIIFDVGLFHALWGIDGCVAQHLDGGYGRFAWCICHTLALMFCLPFAFVARPKPYYLWPLLIQQSAYGIGMLILSLAALPRVLPTFMGDVENTPVIPILVYTVGTLMNFFLLYIYWHWYWHVESEWASARKIRSDRVVDSHNRRSGALPHRPMTNGGTPHKLAVTNGGAVQNGAHRVQNGSPRNGNGPRRTSQAAYSDIAASYIHSTPEKKLSQCSPVSSRCSPNRTPQTETAIHLLPNGTSTTTTTVSTKRSPSTSPIHTGQITPSMGIYPRQALAILPSPTSTTASTAAPVPPQLRKLRAELRRENFSNPSMSSSSGSFIAPLETERIPPVERARRRRELARGSSVDEYTTRAPRNLPRTSDYHSSESVADSESDRDRRKLPETHLSASTHVPATCLPAATAPAPAATLRSAAASDDRRNACSVAPKSSTDALHRAAMPSCIAAQQSGYGRGSAMDYAAQRSTSLGFPHSYSYGH